MAHNTPRNRMTRHLILAGTTLLAIAGTALALPLPIGLDQSASTPAGSYSASAAGEGASACIAPSAPGLPAVPAVPALPIPVPVAVPALPAADAAANVCAGAGLDGVAIDASGSALGQSAAADLDSDAKLDDVKQTADDAHGFFGRLMGRVLSWF